MKSFKSIKGLLAAGVLAAVAAQSASAAFNNGDLILSFQATSGEGVSETVTLDETEGDVDAVDVALVKDDAEEDLVLEDVTDGDGDAVAVVML